LKIEPTAGNGTQRKFEDAISSDSEIKLAVQAAFRLDPRVSAFSPDVTVEDGGVILGGTVGNLKAKTAAAQDAKNIMGVWRVDNLLKVRLNGRTTAAETEKQLKAALSWDPLLNSSAIDVAVINRTAYLSGAVESTLEKAEAQDVASRIKGVMLVRNHLKVEPEFSIFYYDWPYYSHSPYYDAEIFGPRPYLNDTQIKKSIEDWFFWSPFVDRDDIKVTVHGGVATLTGTVGTWIGYGEADQGAHQSGATAVLNRVTVK
jgi:osmotically-inducible protein OsmY